MHLDHTAHLLLNELFDFVRLNILSEPWLHWFNCGREDRTPRCCLCSIPCVTKWKNLRAITGQISSNKVKCLIISGKKDF